MDDAVGSFLDIAKQLGGQLECISTGQYRSVVDELNPVDGREQLLAGLNGVSGMDANDVSGLDVVTHKFLIFLYLNIFTHRIAAYSLRHLLRSICSSALVFTDWNGGMALLENFTPHTCSMRPALVIL